MDKYGVRPLPVLHNKTKTHRDLLASKSSNSSRSSLVVVQSETDSLSHVVPNARRFASNLKAALASSTTKEGGWRALSPAEMGKAWLAAFDASSIVPPTRDMDEQVHAGGNDTQCFVCGLAPLPSFSHTNASNGQCQATDACLAQDVPRTVKGALQAATAASDEPLLLPPQATSLFSSSQRSRRRKMQVEKEEEEEEDSTPPALPTTHLLGYELVLYCRPEEVGQGAMGNCGMTDAQLKAVVKRYMTEALPPGQTNFQLAVANTRPHAAIHEALDETFLQATAAADVGLDDCSTHSDTFNLYLTTSEQAVVSLLQQLVEGASIQSLLAALAHESRETVAEDSLCSLSLAPSMTLTLPALGSKKATTYYQHLYLGKGGGLGNALFGAGHGGRRRNLLAADASGGSSLFSSFWPTVTVLSEKEVAPLSQVVEGERVSIHLQNFSLERAKVVVQLVTAAGGDGSSSTTTIATLDKASMQAEEDDGNWELAWVVPVLPSSRSGGERSSVRCYLRASYVGLPAIFAMSNAFTLRSEA